MLTRPSCPPRITSLSELFVLWCSSACTVLWPRSTEARTARPRRVVDVTRRDGPGLNRVWLGSLFPVSPVVSALRLVETFMSPLYSRSSPQNAPLLALAFYI